MHPDTSKTPLKTSYRQARSSMAPRDPSKIHQDPPLIPPSSPKNLSRFPQDPQKNPPGYLQNSQDTKITLRPPKDNPKIPQDPPNIPAKPFQDPPKALQGPPLKVPIDRQAPISLFNITILLLFVRIFGNSPKFAWTSLLLGLAWPGTWKFPTILLTT